MMLSKTKILLAATFVLGTNYLSYDLGYTDGVRDIIHGIRELQQEIRQQRVDPAADKVVI